MNLLFAVEKGYLDPLKVCLRSILRFSENGGYQIYILHSDLTKAEEEEFQQLFEQNEVTFHFIEINPDVFAAFPESDRYPKQIYYRIFAASFLPKELDRILYLDADTLVINSLHELYEMNFEGNYFLACTHVQEFLSKVNRIRLSISQPVPYINTGVMLMNLEALREIQNIKEVLEYVNKKKEVLLLPDQDIITALYGEQIKLLPSEIYNLSDRILAFHNANVRNTKIDVDWVRENTVILHYCGRRKPWHKNYTGTLGVFYTEMFST